MEDSNSLGKKNQKTKMLSETCGISQHTVQRKVGVAPKKHHNIISSPDSKDVFKTPNRKDYSKFIPTFKAKLNEWIYNHPNVVKSSNSKDTIKMKIPGTNVKEIDPKYYLQIPVHELHKDLMKDPDDD